jgi:NAD(P)-dependent dehydrogenase (short-subunit alcohol dehydrogenase family)
MDLGLRGKAGIVTGASRGIGAAIARELAAEGASVTLAARSAEELNQKVEAIRGSGGSAVACPSDLTEGPVPQRLIDATLGQFGRLDFIVANAGVAKMGDFLTLTQEDWDEGFGLKFFAHMRLLRTAWPELQKSGGTVVIIGGVAGRTPVSTSMVTGSVNGALQSFAKALAARGIEDGVRVNAVNPGMIRTGRFEGRLQKKSAASGVDLSVAEQQMVSDAGVQRVGEPEDIANMVAFLLSERGCYLQGSIIDVDGGKTRTL